jgi:hypothetical protein
MNKLRFILPIAMGLLVFSSVGRAQSTPAAEAPATIAPEDQATKEQMARLFEVMRIREQFASTMKQLPALMQQQVSTQMRSAQEKLGGQTMTADQRAALDTLTRKFMDRALSLYPADEMLADMASLYQRYLSRSDVESLIAFYGTTAGQHLLSAQPAILKEYLPMVMSRMQERTKTLTDEMNKEIQDLSKSSGGSEPK